ncbi:lipoyl(octanoyl) transferase LipB [Sulfuriferula nivalis]|uniref:Octanoyltransferase n=1 Tax=Sulfuriferula nivalis TaxID=2675298 RepID=A0A809RG11_9PROT|nr:lipoyl(octanoyl) transferase LipB [Sulfuriferula nivalis]BBO99813.1 octanoyltransferase [Sulfuriferula nivalis]
MQDITIRKLGRVDYLPTWQAMQDFTAQRGADTVDEIWLLEHPPVYTLGQAGKPEHLLNATNIPLINIDRGGQITYHGPGQLVAYLLIDIKRRGYGVRDLVQRMEQVIIDLLASYNLIAQRRENAPGVYVNDAKIAALGLRIKHGCSYHGLALNVDMDMRPFANINPCGYQGMAVTQLRDLSANIDLNLLNAQLRELLIHHISI